ncbi:hypothetical protein BDZ45DRAFT_152201 [Acephala macrosclerotiorum]|nr:hypothetical protein BDZ45DRAFT_152201 [Acephala macrosclerotiorum]
MHAAYVSWILFWVHFRYFGSHLLAISLWGILDGLMIAGMMSAFVYASYLEPRIVIVAPVNAKWLCTKVDWMEMKYTKKKSFRSALVLTSSTSSSRTWGVTSQNSNAR